MKLRFLFILTSLLFLTTELSAQPGLPGDPAQSPIDGGLFLLLTAGGLYAFRRLRRAKNSK